VSLAPPPPRRPGLWESWTPTQLAVFAVLLLGADPFWRFMVYRLTADVFAASLAAALLAVVLPCLAAAWWHDETLPGAFELRPRRGAALVGLAAGLLGWAPAGALASLSARLRPPTPEYVELIRDQLPTSAAGLVLAGTAAVLVGPLAEELLFRGLLFRLARGRWGFAGAAVLTAVFFGLLHGQPWNLFGLIGRGLLLAALYEWTGSLLAPVAAHAAHNALTLGVLVRARGDLDREVLTGPAGWVFVAVCAGLLAGLLVWLRRRGPAPAASIPRDDRD